jgi:hypothetical protein
MIKSKRLRWVEHVAQMLDKINASGTLVGKPGGRGYLGD